MVPLPVVQAANTTLFQTRPIVAVVVGGTAGIGSYTALSLARTHGSQGKGLRLYIVGRNETAGSKIIAECKAFCPTGDFRFVKARDLSLTREVDRVCGEIAHLEGEGGRVDFLVMTQGFLAFEGRDESKEGLDKFMSVLYYSRMRFIQQLLPLLLRSPSPAHVVSVFGPGRDKSFFPDDISLRSPKNYGFMSSGSHAAYMKTFFMEHLAREHEGKLALMHYFPGLVATESFGDPTWPWWLRWTWKLMAPFSRLFTVPREESGDRVVFMSCAERFPARGEKVVGEGKQGKIEVAVASDGVVGGGAYRVDWNGEVFPIGKQYVKMRADGMDEVFLNHTMKAFEDIEAGKVFTE